MRLDRRERGILCSPRILEAITESAHGFDVGGPELAPQARDENLHGVRVAIEILCVDVLGEFGARDHATGMMHQVREHAELVRCEFHGDPADRSASRACVERESAASELTVSGSAGAPDERADPRENLFDAEWLRDVVIGAAIDAEHLLMPASARGEDEHRRENAGVAPAAEERESVDLGEAEVEDDGVIALGLREEVGLFAIGSAIGRISRGFGCLRELPGEQRLVFDDQDPQPDLYSAAR